MTFGRRGDPHGGLALSSTDLFRLAVACGLLFGLLEAIETAWLRGVPDVRPMRKVSLDVLWSTPLVHVAVNLLGAAGLTMLARLGLPVRYIRYLAPLAFAFVGACGVLWYSTFLAPVACVILSAGIGVQFARFWAARGSTRLSSRASAWLALVVLAAALGVRVADWGSASNAASAPASPDARPNVLLIVLDTVRADRLSAYGWTSTSTPSIDALAREGTLFERAHSTSSWTLPSHASMLTGLPAPSHGAESIRDVLRGDHLQLQQVLRAQGYATGAFVSNSLFFVPERGFGRGFEAFNVYEPRTLMARSAFGFQVDGWMRRFNVQVDAFRSASAINRAFQRWVDSVGDRPYFAVLNYMDAHEPYYSDTIRPDLRVWDLKKRRSPEQNAQLAAEYAGAIAWIDREIGRLVSWLSARSSWERTLVVVTSDHGELIADGSFDHGMDLTMELIHVPLIMRFPGQVPAGMRVGAPVSLADLAATVQSLANDRGPRLPGRSLSRWFDPETAGDPDSEVVHAAVIDANDPDATRRLESVVLAGYQYIHDVSSGKKRLFDVRADIAGEHNLAANPQYADLLQRLETALRLPVKAQAGLGAAPLR